MSAHDNLTNTDAPAAPAGRVPVTSFEDPRSRTIPEFCEIENYSLSSFFALQRKKLGPRVTRPPGTKLGRITKEAHVEWREKMEALTASEEAVLEQERRRRQAQEAGRRSVQARHQAAS